MTNPLPKTRTELENILAGELEAIIQNHITLNALDHRCTDLSYQDLSANLHLWERLSAAANALQALRGYKGEAQTFELISPGPARLR